MNLAAKDAFFEKDFYQLAKQMGYRSGLAGKNHTDLKPVGLDFWREYGHTAGCLPPHPDKEVLAYEEWIKPLGRGSVSTQPPPFPVETGSEKMVRMGDWKLVYDMMDHGQLYHLPSDPGELKNLFGQASVARVQAQLAAELLMWTIRSQDSLPTGPQSRHYQTKWSRQHNWYTPYRHGKGPEAFLA